MNGSRTNDISVGINHLWMRLDVVRILKTAGVFSLSLQSRDIFQKQIIKMYENDIHFFFIYLLQVFFFGKHVFPLCPSLYGFFRHS